MTTLNELAHPPKRTVTHDDKEHRVYPADGFAMQLSQEPPTDRVGMIRRMYEIAARCLDLPFDEVFGTPEKRGWSEGEVMEVLDLAQQQVKRVEATAKNDGSAGAANGEEKAPHPSGQSQPTLLAS